MLRVKDASTWVPASNNLCLVLLPILVTTVCHATLFYGLIPLLLFVIAGVKSIKRSLAAQVNFHHRDIINNWRARHSCLE